MQRTKHFFVYRTTNRVNGKYYIGVHETYDLADDYLGSGVALKAAIRKYGKEKFKRRILARFSTREAAYDYEKRILRRHLGRKNCYNIAEGGKGGWSARTREKALEAVRNKFPPKTYACSQCGTEFVTTRSRNRKTRTTELFFCSRLCTGKYHGSTDSIQKAIEARKTNPGNVGARNGAFGKTYISHDEAQLTMRVPRDEIQDYLDKGWRAGRVMRYTHVRDYLLEQP